MIAFLDSGLFHRLVALPVDLADMQQTFLTRHELYETTVRHEALNHRVILLAYFRQSHNSFDLRDRCLHRLAVVACYLNLTALLVFVNRDDSAGLSLDALDNLSARANNSTDHILRNIEAYNARSVRLQISTRFRHALKDLTEDIHACLVCLCERVLQNLITQTIYLDIHLARCQTVFGTRGLEVHIAEVVLVTENITQDSVVLTLVLRDKTHSDTAHRFLHRNTCIHQRQRAGTNGCHRARTIRLQNITYYTYGIRKIFRNHVLQRAASQVTVTNLTTAYATSSLSLTR